MQKILGVFVVTLVVITASVAVTDPAHAQPAAKTSDKGNDKAAGSKVKVYDFSGDTIEGDLIRPEGTTVDARDFAKHSSLIRIRTNFIPEIIKSAEDL
ncbi:MAG TPA: hypothetical protein VF516_07960 [Kofleriaceae bacterium]